MSRTEVANLRINEGKSNDPDGVIAEHNENEAEVQNSELTILQKHSLQEIRASAAGKFPLDQNFVTTCFFYFCDLSSDDKQRQGHNFKSWLMMVVGKAL